MKSTLAVLTFGAVVVATGTASAQMPPPPPAAQPAGGEEMRFRWGVSGFGGKYFVNGTGGGIGGIDARFGVQIDNMIGVYGSPILLLGAGAAATNTATSSAVSVSAVGLYGIGALVDFTFSDMFFVAVGPELLRGAAAQAATQADSNGNASASASGEVGTFFGIEARAGLALGSIKPNKRKAFTIGLDLHAIFTSKVTVVPLLALGYDMF